MSNPRPSPDGMAEQRTMIPGHSHGLSLKARQSSSLATKHIFDQMHAKVQLALGLSPDCSQMETELVSESWLQPTMHNSSSSPPPPFAPHQSSACPRQSSVLGKLQQQSQLTIFYSGIVNVYDDVPADKAHAIMVLAGTNSASSWSFVSNDDSPHVAVPNLDGSKNMMEIEHPQPQPQPKPKHPNSELPQARKASLSRFLERRRYRIHTKTLSVENSAKEDQDITDVGDNACNYNDLPPMEKLLGKRSPSPSNPRSRCNSPLLVCEE